MNIRQLLLSAMVGTIGILGSPAQAGWTSGGGELIRDAGNPWFLENTKNVSYCIEIDEANMGISRARVQHLVRAAIENWKLEFKSSSIPAYLKGGQQLAVATQDFQEVTCSQNVDLKIQLGVLSGQQIAKIGDPTKFLGITVRTSYDRVNMRGKGFIYISPAHGPLKFSGDNVRENVWSIGDGALLYGVLLHEFGHIFGLNHSAGYLMSERYPEIITSKDRLGEEEALKDLPRPWVFDLPDRGIDLHMSLCSTPGESVPSEGPRLNRPILEVLREFFGVDNGTRGFSVVVSNSGINVYAGDCESMELIGKTQLRKLRSCSPEYGLGGCKPSMWNWFPEEQKVFAGETWGLKVGPYVSSEVIASGIYETLDGRVKREVGVRTDFSRWMPAVGGVMNGKMYLNLLEGY